MDREAQYQEIRSRVEEIGAMVYARSRDWHVEKLLEAGKIEQAKMYREMYNQEREEYHKLVADKYILAILTGRYDHALDLLLNDHNEAVRKAAETRFSEARSDVEQAIAERIAAEKERDVFYQELMAQPPEGWGSKKYQTEEERQRAWERLDPRDRLGTARAWSANKAPK